MKRTMTIGFTQKTADRFFNLLRESGARRVVDVRANNTSQLAAFAKRDDLAWFLRELCDMDYVHVPELAPTKELLKAYRTGVIDWREYETRFLNLMRERRIDATLPREVIDGGCLLCSEDQPHHCHRRLVAEYLASRWGDLEIDHLGACAVGHFAAGRMARFDDEPACATVESVDGSARAHTGSLVRSNRPSFGSISGKYRHRQAA